MVKNLGFKEAVESVVAQIAHRFFHLSMGTVNESRIRATSAAHKCPYSLLYHSGKRPLKKTKERSHWAIN